MTITPTPVERAARAHGIARDARFDGLGDTWGDLTPEDRAAECEDMREALVAALDVDEIARVLGEHSDYGSAGRGWTCVCGKPLADGSASASDLFHAHQAAALIEHLTQTGVTR